MLQAEISAAGHRGRTADEATQPAYAGPAQHAVDLLRRVDLLLQREILRYRASRARTGVSPETEWLRFAAITDEEIDDLLVPTAPGQAGDASASAQQQLDLQLARLATEQAERVASGTRAGLALPALQLVRRLGLTSQELDVVALCLAAEIDRRYERIYGYLHDDMTRRRPSAGLAMDICAVTRETRIGLRSLFAPDAALVRHRIVHIGDDASPSQPFPSRSLRLDERVLRFLLGQDGIDAQLRDAATLSLPGPRRPHLTAAQEGALRQILGLCAERRSAGQRAPIFYITSREPGTHSIIAHELSGRLDVPLLEVDAEQLGACGAGFQEGLALALRETLLTGAILLLHQVDRALDHEAGRLRGRELGRSLAGHDGPVLLAGEKPWSWPIPSADWFPVPIVLHRPGYLEQVELWRAALRPVAQLQEAELNRLASVYPLGPVRLAEVVRLAKELATLRGDRELGPRDIERSCREQSQGNFGQLARKIEPKFGWEDLVLPAAQTQQLREICAQAKYRSLVFGRWGFDRKLSLGRGLNVLFAGVSGTGKTMSAEIIATDLGLDLYKIDLSQVVSKYIGETEKNLHQIFRVADAAHAILLFDEADALLGRRSEVKDAHDRYANIEVAYLLQKMEEYEGITVLATNLRQNIDEAFTRRIRFVVEFPFPEEEDRLRIWRGIWPAEVPLAPDLDLAQLAQEFHLSGGSIRNVALAAAFRAAEQDCGVGMKQLVRAAKRELRKMGRLVEDEEHARDE